MYARLLALGLCAALLSLPCSPARAEIIKTAVTDCAGARLCFYWWPKLPPLAGWHTDNHANFNYGENGINTLVPNGTDFDHADTIIYANAVYKKRYELTHPNIKSLSAFIDDDEGTYFKNADHPPVAKVTSLTTTDGQAMRSFTYFRPHDNSWERVSYGEEGDFYLLIVISSHSEAGYRANQGNYAYVVQHYRH